MANNTIRVRARIEHDYTSVRVLIKHPMETGRRLGKSGRIIPPHYITEFICQWNGTTIVKGNLGPGISKDPYLAFEFSGAKPGDTLKFSWRDNRGESDNLATVLS